jgi:hypothetical protein
MPALHEGDRVDTHSKDPVECMVSLRRYAWRRCTTGLPTHTQRPWKIGQHCCLCFTQCRTWQSHLFTPSTVLTTDSAQSHTKTSRERGRRDSEISWSCKGQDECQREDNASCNGRMSSSPGLTACRRPQASKIILKPISCA